MRIQKTVENLWKDLIKAIDTASDDTGAIRDYSEYRNYAALENLLQEETANERRHRSGWPKTTDLGPRIAAKILILKNVAKGAKQEKCAPAWEFLVYRRSAVESSTLGWLIQGALSAE